MGALELSALGSIEYAYQVFPGGEPFGRADNGNGFGASGRTDGHAIEWGECGSTIDSIHCDGINLSLGALWLGEVALPSAQAEIDSLRLTKLRQKSALNRYFTKELQWFRQGDWMMHLPVPGRTGESFREPILYRMEEGLVAEVLHAEELVYENDSWILNDVERFYPVVEHQKKSASGYPFEAISRGFTDVAGNPSPYAIIGHS